MGGSFPGPRSLVYVLLRIQEREHPAPSGRLPPLAIFLPIEFLVFALGWHTEWSGDEGGSVATIGGALRGSCDAARVWWWRELRGTDKRALRVGTGVDGG